MGDKTKRNCRLLTAFRGFFLINNIRFVFHNICNVSQQQTTELCYWGELNSQNINILCTSFCRVDKRIAIVSSGYVCLITTLVQSLASAADGLPVTPPGKLQAREECPPQAVWLGEDVARRCGVGGLALPCPGARERHRERDARRGALLIEGWEEREPDDGGLRHVREVGEGGLLLRGGRCWGGGGDGGHFLGALPVLLWSRAWTRGGAGAWGGGLGRAGSRSRGWAGALGVVHVLSSRPSVRLPMGVVVLSETQKTVTESA